LDRASRAVDDATRVYPTAPIFPPGTLLDLRISQIAAGLCNKSLQQEIATFRLNPIGSLDRLPRSRAAQA
jgi:hypothetical protein